MRHSFRVVSFQLLVFSRSRGKRLAAPWLAGELVPKGNLTVSVRVGDFLGACNSILVE
jgi:hypothetical protein